MRRKTIEKQYQVRNFAEVRNFAWHRLFPVVEVTFLAQNQVSTCNWYWSAIGLLRLHTNVLFSIVYTPLIFYSSMENV